MWKPAERIRFEPARGHMPTADQARASGDAAAATRLGQQARKLHEREAAARTSAAAAAAFY